MNKYDIKIQKKNLKDIKFISLTDFVVQDQIGSGSFGKVYKIKEKATGKIFAAKISNFEIDKSSEDIIVNLKREVNIISKLNHPSILKYFYFSPYNFKKKKKPVLITEFASNSTLKEMIYNKNNTYFTDTNKIIIIYGIASAMLYLHSHGIIHRDLKPENILLDEYFFPKIADFGLSKNIHPTQESTMYKTIINNVKGTPIYMSPEIWENGEYSEKSDVYAFAIVVYEIMTKQKPFENENYFNLLLKIKSGARPQFNSPISESYKNLIQSCWATEPSERPTFDEILKILKEDKGFVTFVDEDLYLNYIRYIDEYNISFNTSKNNAFIYYNDSLNNNNCVHLNINGINDFINNDVGSFLSYKQYTQLNENCKDLINKAKNDLNTQFLVAQSFIEGWNYFPQNTEAGIKILKKSIFNGCIDSLIYYINMIIKGNIIYKDLDKAKRLLQSHFNDQDPIYLLLLGKIMIKSKKYNEAKDLFEKSIKLNNGDAMYEYSKLILKGRIMPINYELAIDYLNKSIKENCLKAFFKYGLILKEKRNKKEESSHLIKLAADGGYLKAIYYYALMLENGDNIPINKEISSYYMKKASDKGHVQAMHKYSILISNTKESIRLLKKASHKGNIDSMYLYASLVTNGDSDSSDLTMASEYIKIAANNGNGDAMALYGNMLLFGEEIEDEEEAIKYLKNGIKKGSSDAMKNYAYIKHHGYGSKVNIDEAVKYYKMAIEKGNREAMNNYGCMLQYGDGIDIDKEEAIKYYKMAINKGNPVSMYNYAYMLDIGDGIDVDKEEAIKYYKMAIEQEYPEAMCNYAFMLNNGDGIDVDKKEAIKYYKMAISKGNSEAMHNYAYMLDIGDGIDVNKEKAIKYYKMAIEKGNTSSMYNYAYMLENGDGIKINLKESLKYYKKSADEGNSAAMNKYATMLQYGVGIDFDIKGAMKYYKMAIDKGNNDAMYNYAWLKDHNEKKYKNQVIKYYKMAINNGNEYAMNNYACMIAFGDGIKVNDDDAIKYFKMSLDKGNDQAMNNYACILKYHANIANLSTTENILLLDNGNGIEMYKNKLILNNFLYEPNEIVTNFKNAIAKGNSYSMYNYGLMLEIGEGIESNIEESIKYYKMAIEKGNSYAMNKYASILQTRKNFLDKFNAVKYYKMAADNGLVEAMNSYANMLFNGHGNGTIKEAAEYYKKAADKGLSSSLYMYTQLLINKEIVGSFNKEDDIKYYKMAIEEGFQNKEMLVEGIIDILIKKEYLPFMDHEKYLDYYKFTAKNGSLRGLYMYGKKIYKSYTPISDKISAIDCIKRSADGGYSKPMRRYA